jgi:putative ABC transport system permease protein
LKAIATEVPSVRYVAPQLRSMVQVMSEDQNWSTTINGTTPEYFDIRSWGMDKGERFSVSDVESGNKVVVLGQTVVEKLFGTQVDPVGHSIRIKNIPFTVVGVTQKKGQSPQGQDFDDAVFIPYTTFQSKIQGGLQKFIGGVIFVGTVAGATSKAQSQVANLLRDRHNIQPGADDDFSIRNLTEMATAQQEGTQVLTTLLASIALVSLLVGGIGIMNIMLVSCPSPEG